MALTIIKARGDECINTVRPRLAVKTWNSIPAPEARPETHAAYFPWLSPLPTAKILSGPGDITKSKQARV